MFKKLKEVKIYRKNKTVDMVKRLGVLTANNIRLERYPIKRPVSIFNPSILIEDGDVHIYGRMVLGYFTYASVISEITMPIGDLRELKDSYSAKIEIYPDNKFDLWGVEDPRIYVMDGKKFITYCGRTVNYFNQSIWRERTLPVTAVYEDGRWKKLSVFRMPQEIRGFVISDKDAFLVKSKNGLKLFHRLHLKDDNYYLVISDVQGTLEGNGLKEVEVKNTYLLMEPAEFEEKLGWGTPPIELEEEYLLLIHAVDREMKSYKVFAILLNRDLELIAVTPYYIMEPKEIYEIYGDRPYTIFPCGAQVVDDKLIVSYGAGDIAMAFGEIDLDELISLLYSNPVG
ncbi:MAG: glycosidase [Thermoplasmata archaeon]|nr:MAG: glycosidase [Thermoplasmata archaeon]